VEYYHVVFTLPAPIADLAYQNKAELYGLLFDVAAEVLQTIAAERGVSFKWKDYRAKGSTRHKTMTLAPNEFMRRFLLHVLPGGFHRIRHYGLLANGNRRECLALARQLLGAAPTQAVTPSSDEQADGPPNAVPPAFVCRHCGQAMVIVQSWVRGQAIRAPPPS
jgi:hypothetical protein